ncbi:hypothetical protein JL722_9806 [Aureococcus anophagefferens]|nr:hypothetical protein JL722_9806 [Aureococcus anophagefferens]
MKTPRGGDEAKAAAPAPPIARPRATASGPGGFMSAKPSPRGGTVRSFGATFKVAPAAERGAKPGDARNGDGRRSWELRSRSMLAAGAAARAGVAAPGKGGASLRKLGSFHRFVGGAERAANRAGSIAFGIGASASAGAAAGGAPGEGARGLGRRGLPARRPFGQCVLLGVVALCQIAVGTGMWCVTGGTSIPADERVLPKLVAIVLSVSGFAFNLVVMGLIVEYVRKTLRWWRLTRGRVVLNDHVVILGWTDRTLFLCSELCEMAQCSQRTNQTIVILGDIEEDEMRAEIRLTFPNWSTSWPGVRVKVVNGKAFEVDDLMKTITTVLALCALYTGISGMLISELRLGQSVPIVRQLGGRHVVPIVTTTVVDAVLAECLMDPTVGNGYLDIMTSEGNDIESLSADAAGLVKCTFGEARRRFPRAVLCGVAEAPAASEDHFLTTVPAIAPPDDLVIRAGEVLLFMADSKDALSLDDSCAAEAEAEGRGERHLAPRSAKDARGDGRRKFIVILGWQRSVARVLAELDKRLGPGSVAHALSVAPLEKRRRELLAVQTLENLRVVHHVGYPTDAAEIERLPLSDADVALIVADIDDDIEGHGGSELQIADSEVYTATFLLRAQCEDVPIVAEFSDVLAMRLLKQQPDILRSLQFATLDTLDANAPVKALYRAGTSSRGTGARARGRAGVAAARGARALDAPAALLGVYDARQMRQAKIRADGADAYVRPAELRVDGRQLGERLSFIQLAERVRIQTGGLLVGWRRADGKGETEAAFRGERGRQRAASNGDVLISATNLISDLDDPKAHRGARDVVARDGSRLAAPDLAAAATNGGGSPRTDGSPRAKSPHRCLIRVAARRRLVRVAAPRPSTMSRSAEAHSERKHANEAMTVAHFDAASHLAPAAPPLAPGLMPLMPLPGFLPPPGLVYPAPVMAPFPAAALARRVPPPGLLRAAAAAAGPPGDAAAAGDRGRTTPEHKVPGAMENYSRSAPNVLFQGALEGPSDADARYAATPAMVLHGNQETFNLNPLLANCILNHEYSRVLWEMGPSFDKLVAEARTKVTHVEPWQRGTSRTPSTAFCIVMRLFQLNLHEGHVRALLDQRDAPWVRCVGFLYLRYVCPPGDLWKWCEDVLLDDGAAPVEPRGDVSLSQWLRGLLTDQKYFGTILPRIPLKIERMLKANATMLGASPGARRAIYGDEKNEPAWYEAVVEGEPVESKDDAGAKVLKYWVTFPEYGNSELVRLGDIEIDGPPPPDDEEEEEDARPVGKYAKKRKTAAAGPPRPASPPRGDRMAEPPRPRRRGLRPPRRRRLRPRRYDRRDDGRRDEGAYDRRDRDRGDDRDRDRGDDRRPPRAPTTSRRARSPTRAGTVRRDEDRADDRGAERRRDTAARGAFCHKQRTHPFTKPMAESGDDLVDDPRAAVDLKKKAAEVSSAVVNRTYAAAHFAIQTPTSRYVAAVLGECARYAAARAARAVARAQQSAAGDAAYDWSHADAVSGGERWLTLNWYERQLVEPKPGEVPRVAEEAAAPSALREAADADFAGWAARHDDDEEAGYHLATLAAVAPAAWQLSTACAACRAPFGPALHRHHCRLCGRSVCRRHGGASGPCRASRRTWRLARVCDECDDALDGLAREERAAWRVCRVAALLDDGAVAPYFDVARRCPLLAPATVTITVEVLEILVRYGPAGLATLVLRREFVEAAELLRRVAGVAAWPKSAHELTAAIYYLLAFRRGERGADPEQERRDHAGDAPCDGATLAELKAAAAAALWCYAESPTAVQLVAGQQGWTLLFERGFLAEPFAPERDVVAEPAFFCIASGPGGRARSCSPSAHGVRARRRDGHPRRARGLPPPPDGAGDWTAVGGTFAFAGMARAAQYIFDETAPRSRDGGLRHRASTRSSRGAASAAAS